MNYTQRAGVAGALAAMLLAGSLFGAAAHEDATGIVKARMDAMKEMGGAMKQIGMMMKGITPYDGAAAAKAAMVINKRSGKIHELFPKGSDTHESYAKPELWNNWDEFTGFAKATGAASQTLSKAAVDGARADVLPLFFGVGKSCKACHTKYRRSKDNE